MANKVKIRGLEKVLKNLNEKESKIREIVVKEVESACLDLEGKAISQTPLLNGDLRGSSLIDIDVKPNKVVGEVSFNTEYALEIHENLDINHPIHYCPKCGTRDCQGHAKYLERPLYENESKYQKEIEKAVKEYLK